MSSNYPPGVTGNEPEIAGTTSRAVTVAFDCDRCQFSGEVEAEQSMTSRSAHSIEFVEFIVCPGCGRQLERDGVEEF